jgi:tyrosinase
MVNKAREYNDETIQKKYLDAASRFRFPYWDPCLPRQLKKGLDGDSHDSSGVPNEFGVPMIVSSPKVFVRFPESPDQLTSVDNPLYQYNFPDSYHYPNNPGSFWQHPTRNILLEDPAFNGTEHTVRAPDKNGNEDDGYINSYMQNHIQSDIGSSLYKVLTAHQKWTVFSNDVYDNQAAEQANGQGPYVDHTLEGFHDNIHVFLSQGKLGMGRQQKGSGHIGDPSYAAFDPIFWLHHRSVTEGLNGEHG